MLGPYVHMSPLTVKLLSGGIGLCLYPETKSNPHLENNRVVLAIVKDDVISVQTSPISQDQMQTCRQMSSHLDAGPKPGSKRVRIYQAKDLLRQL